MSAEQLKPIPGTFGGSVQNANHVMAQFIAGLHLPNGSISIPGLYE